jgi:hypothetical protein
MWQSRSTCDIEEFCEAMANTRREKDLHIRIKEMHTHMTETEMKEEEEELKQREEALKTKGKFEDTGEIIEEA